MSHTNIDPALTAREDAQFRAAVHAFLQTTPPAAMNATTRDVLQSLVNSYGFTSRNDQMAQLLLALHHTYNITSLVNVATLVEASNTINGIQNAPAAVNPTTPAQDLGRSSYNMPQRGMQTPRAMLFDSPPGQMQSPSAMPSNSPADTSEYPLGPLLNSPFGPSQYPSALRFDSPPGQSQYPSTFPTNSPPAQSHGGSHVDREHPHDIEDRDKDWLYRCDMCNHPILYRSEFNRHARSAGRGVFKVVDTNINARRWRAEDATGNQYSGAMMRVSERTSGARPIPEPCKSYIREHNAAKKREQGAATNEKGGN